MPNDTKGLVELVRRESGGAKPNVDPKTLRLGSKMSPKSMMRVLRYLLREIRRAGFGPLPSLRALRDSLPSNSQTPNTLYWRTYAANWRPSDPSVFPAVTLAFVEQHCDQEDILMEEMKALSAQPGAA